MKNLIEATLAKRIDKDENRFFIKAILREEDNCIQITPKWESLSGTTDTAHIKLDPKIKDMVDSIFITFGSNDNATLKWGGICVPIPFDLPEKYSEKEIEMLFSRKDRKNVRDRSNDVKKAFNNSINLFQNYINFNDYINYIEKY